MERILELAHIALNKNTVPGDKSAMVPGGIRMGSPALTSRGFIEPDFDAVADFVHRGIQIAQQLKSQSGAPLLALDAVSCIGAPWSPGAAFLLMVSLMPLLDWYEQPCPSVGSVQDVRLPCISVLLSDVSIAAPWGPTAGRNCRTSGHCLLD